jgi:hypothetical protein
MKHSQWLAGAFSAYGLAGSIGKGNKVSLLTTSNTMEYVKTFHEYAGMGRIEVKSGLWRWVCDVPIEVQTFYMAVGPRLTGAKREMIEASWEQWRRHAIDHEFGDPGPIDGPLFPDLSGNGDGATAVSSAP